MSLAGEGRHAASPRIIDEAPHQAGLADASFALDRERRRPPLAEVAHGSGSYGELGLSSYQPVRRAHP